MWAGAWNNEATVFTGVWSEPNGSLRWTGSVAVGSDPGSYIWDGKWE